MENEASVPDLQELAERVLELEQVVAALAADIHTNLELSRIRTKCPDLYSSTLQRYAEVIASCHAALAARNPDYKNDRLALELYTIIALKAQMRQSRQQQQQQQQQQPPGSTGV